MEHIVWEKIIMFEKEESVYKLFISHIDEDDHEYNIFLDKLSASSDFRYKDCAIKEKVSPEDLERQMKPVDVVIILSGLCFKNQKLMERQVDAARKLNKPLVIIRPYGMENVPAKLGEVASGVVGWNTSCIVDTIRESSSYGAAYE